MSEASDIFDMIRRAVAFSEPDCDAITFETFAVGNETGYRIWHGAGKYPMTWSSDDEFLNGSYDRCSIRVVTRRIVELFKDGLPSDWKSFLPRYPRLVDVFRAVSESSSSEELRLRLTASGLL